MLGSTNEILMDAEPTEAVDTLRANIDRVEASLSANIHRVETSLSDDIRRVETSLGDDLRRVRPLCVTTFVESRHL